MSQINTSSTQMGVLLVNLGTPDSFEIKDVRRYLAEFLMDKYVLDVPYFLRALLVYGIILPFRPKKSAAAYKSIWWDEGSPLMVLSQQLLAACKEKSSHHISLGMRYGNPSIKAGIDDLLKQNPSLTHVKLIPLYPHYAMSSFQTVVEKTKTVIDRYFPQLVLECISPFYQEPAYIQALANSIKPYLDKVDYVLFSYHGIPKRHLNVTDPTNAHCNKVENCCKVANTQAHQVCYRHQCVQTTQKTLDVLGSAVKDWGLSFQSRLGPEPWLTPYTDKTIEELAQKGVKRLAIVCPAFVSDCLETLEEMGEEGKEIFEEHGGESFHLIPCLNTNPDWVDALVSYF